MKWEVYRLGSFFSSDILIHRCKTKKEAQEVAQKLAIQNHSARYKVVKVGG